MPTLELIAQIEWLRGLVKEMGTLLDEHILMIDKGIFLTRVDKLYGLDIEIMSRVRKIMEGK